MSASIATLNTLGGPPAAVGQGAPQQAAHHRFLARGGP